MTRASVSFALAACIAAAPTAADLRDEPAITEGLIAVGIAYEIGEVCPSIDGRTLRGLGRLMSLRGRAKALGYSESEIEAFVDDDAEKDRLEAVARDRLARMGARPGDAASHCAVGRAEVARGSAVGRLLKVR